MLTVTAKLCAGLPFMTLEKMFQSILPLGRRNAALN
jgi:hypothetical protein